MPSSRARLLVALLALATAAGKAGAQDSRPTPKATNDALREELLRRLKEDQAAHGEYLEWIKTRGWAPGKVAEDPAAILGKMREVERKNTAWLKEVVDRYGWPGTTLVGRDGADAAWILVQHADHDHLFQKRCVLLLREAVKRGEATGQHLAYLTDRVLNSEGRKQIYGTQLRIVDGKVVPKPIEEEADVDQRRADLGLVPLKDYLESSQKMLSPRKSPR